VHGREALHHVDYKGEEVWIRDMGRIWNLVSKAVFDESLMKWGREDIY
jgi:hypothetical protein